MTKKEPSEPCGSCCVVKPGEKVDLARFDCGATFGRQKDEADDILAANLARLTDLQARIYAEAKHAVLIVLQGSMRPARTARSRSSPGRSTRRERRSRRSRSPRRRARP